MKWTERMLSGQTDLVLHCPGYPKSQQPWDVQCRQIWAAGTGTHTGTACRLAEQYPDPVLIRTERHKGSKDLWERAEKLLLRVSKNSREAVRTTHSNIVPQSLFLMFAFCCLYHLMINVPFLYHLCTCMCIYVYPYWSTQPMHYFRE